MVDRSAGMPVNQLLALPSTDRAQSKEEQADTLNLHNDCDVAALTSLGPIEDLRGFRE